jgi:hypothetical protein
MQNAKTQCLSHDDMEFRSEVSTFTFRLTKAPTPTVKVTKHGALLSHMTL